MKVAAVIVVAFLAIGYYVQHGYGSKMSAAKLQRLVYTKSLQWEPNHPMRLNCRHDPVGQWDYICTDSYLRQTWGYDVNHRQVTHSRLLYQDRG